MERSNYGAWETTNVKILWESFTLFSLNSLKCDGKVCLVSGKRDKKNTQSNIIQDLLLYFNASLRKISAKIDFILTEKR